MATKRLKILLAVLIIILVFMLGFNTWHGEDLITEMQVPLTVETGAVATWNVEINSWAAIDTWFEIDIWEATERELASKLNSLVGDYNISYTIVHECSEQTADYQLCIKNVLWVANAESSMFKNWMKPTNNWFWWLYKGKKKRFSSVQDSIKQWVAMYVRNGWSKRTTGQSRIDNKYCTSSCSNRVSAYNSAVQKIDKIGLD